MLIFFERNMTQIFVINERMLSAFKTKKLTYLIQSMTTNVMNMTF